MPGSSDDRRKDGGKGRGQPRAPAQSALLQGPAILALWPPRVIFMHSGPRASGPRGPILPSLWEWLLPKAPAQPAWPSTGLSQADDLLFCGLVTSCSQAAPLLMGTSILIWKSFRHRRQSRCVETEGHHTRAHPTPRGGTDPGAFLEAVCGDPLGAGGDPFTGCRGGSVSC